MNQLGATNLVGINMEDLQSDLSKQEEKDIAESLQKKGILLPDGKQGLAWDAQARAALDAVLIPEQMLIVIRDRKGEGRRFFRVLQKGKAIALHSFPNDREHLIGVFQQPEDILRLMMDWFPFNKLPYAAITFKMDKLSFDNFRALMIEKKKEEALKAFNPDGLDAAQKLSFLRCLRNATLSGSVARVGIQDGSPKEGGSIAFLTDGRAGWLITQDDSDNPENIMLTVQRTGVDLAGALRAQIESFSGCKLLRRQTDPSNNSVRFALSSDELAKALSAVNCRELSMKMYAGAAQDMTGDHYAERMKKAEQSLVEAGLCRLSHSGMPILAEDLAHAILPIGASDSMIQIVQSGSGSPEDLGVYLIRGRLFTAYFNYGEMLQILVNGKYQDTGVFIQSLFPEFGSEEGEKKIDGWLSKEVLEKVMHKVKNQDEAKALLVSDGMEVAAARTFVEDISDALYHATLTRREMPDRKIHEQGIAENQPPLSLFLLQSKRNSWLIQFQDPGRKGTASIADREAFREALTRLII